MSLLIIKRKEEIELLKNRSYKEMVFFSNNKEKD